MSFTPPPDKFPGFCIQGRFCVSGKNFGMVHAKCIFKEISLLMRAKVIPGYFFPDYVFSDNIGIPGSHYLMLVLFFGDQSTHLKQSFACT